MNVATMRAWVLALCAPAGCYGGLDGGGADASGTEGGTDGSGGAQQTDEASDADGSDGGPDDGPPDASCDGEALPPVTLRYLTQHEYEHTIRDLFGTALDVTGSFAPDEVVGGYFSNSVQAPSTTQLERFLEAAQTLGETTVSQRLAQFVACEADDEGCAATFIAVFGRRVFRRPLTEAEQDDYLSDFEAVAADQGAVFGLEVVVSAMLSSPHFLYIGERSALADPQARAYDLASRLSYFIWASMPDETLMDAADSGQLATVDEVEAQVRRMLGDDRAADMLTSFSTQWLEVDALAASAPKHAELFPEWNSDLADAAELETSTLMQRVVMDGDARLTTWLESREAYVDASLAALYGVAAPEGGAGWITLPEGQRSGPLTRVAFLARHAHASENSWVHRGKVVRERLLCGTLPPPPPVADDSPINDDSRLTDPACSGCHTLMDPIGVGFEGYDPIGRYDGGAAPGYVEGLEEPEFDGPVQLSAQLADSVAVQACFAQQLYRYANRRAAGVADRCAIEAVAERFSETDGDIVELIVALATANAFTGGIAGGQGE
ncbi:MAG: DUF1592 domain-containing protein [Nannocystaceae bacterium]|nr:DUF1592 domain-containing protein [Nannocystaceae bacterium]